MESFNFIEYHRARDFSRKMNATFEFIRQNFKPLSKSMLFIAGPPVLIASIIMATFLDDFIGLTRAAATSVGDTEAIETYFFSVNFWLQATLMFLLFLVSAIMSIATVNNYVLLYEEKRSNRIEPADVWARVRDTFWMYFSTTLIFFVLFIIVTTVMMIPVGLIAALSPVMIFFAVIALYCGIIYLMIGASLTYVIRAYEKKGFFEALERSFKLVYNKWWSTFGLIFILYLIMLIASYTLMFAGSIISSAASLHTTSTEVNEQVGWISISFVILIYLVQMFLGTLPNIGIAFQYFNLVELKEAKGLLGKIDTLGQVQPPTSTDDQY
jgi:hypothetical protein